MNRSYHNIIYKEVDIMYGLIERNMSFKINIKENKINKEKNMDKIYSKLIRELDHLKSEFQKDEEQLWELNLIEEEANEIKESIKKEILCNIVYSKFIDYKYAELYTKILNNIKIINDKDVNIRNRIMFDFLSEIFSNIYDYTNTVLSKFINEKKEQVSNSKKIDIPSKIQIKEEKYMDKQYKNHIELEIAA
ncbi:hypothetical protein ACSW9N_13270 [Clostridium perfringens]|uniref:hypothetical protein n=1 Tax=Clostridium perfringens TaxID=1502 RepID=UPI00285C50B8|nr:hypothetical protein [Clostridium perfringens]MDM0687185.1 hypothetical protein [Clostridium perfringens]